VDDCCCTGNSVDVGTGDRLYNGLFYSYPAGRCHHRRGDASYSGTKGIVAIWTIAGEGEAFRNEGASRPRMILPKLAILLGEKVS
jgi:hypothetical protein